MGEDPDRIRAEIEQTRAEMGETVDALGYKTDVKARQGLDRTRRRASWASRTGVVAAPTPRPGRAGQAARRGAPRASPQENPLGLAVGAVAVGFLAGMLIPSTRVEDEKLGAISDDVIDRAKETGQEALERGKQVAQDAGRRPRRRAAASTPRSSSRPRRTTPRRRPPR